MCHVHRLEARESSGGPNGCASPAAANGCPRRRPCSADRLVRRCGGPCGSDGSCGDLRPAHAHAVQASVSTRAAGLVVRMGPGPAGSRACGSKRQACARARAAAEHRISASHWSGGGASASRPGHTSLFLRTQAEVESLSLRQIPCGADLPGQCQGMARLCKHSIRPKRDPQKC